MNQSEKFYWGYWCLLGSNKTKDKSDTTTYRVFHLKIGKIFCEINSLVTSLVELLLSRNFC